ncbi:MAG: hypothetical protein VYA38_07510 [Gemmatimonadota bacterium]|nr:hypothetical protein [Gemmatimonadota bacterium]
MKWSVCASDHRRRAITIPIPSAPRAHGAWGGTKATAGARISPATSGIEARLALHVVLRLSIRALAGTTSKPNSVIRAGTRISVAGGADETGSGVSPMAFLSMNFDLGVIHPALGT